MKFLKAGMMKNHLPSISEIDAHYINFTKIHFPDMLELVICSRNNLETPINRMNAYLDLISIIRTKIVEMGGSKYADNNGEVPTAYPYLNACKNTKLSDKERLFHAREAYNHHNNVLVGLVLDN